MEVGEGRGRCGQLVHKVRGRRPGVPEDVQRGLVTLARDLDKSIQVHGPGGLSQDFPLANMAAGIRTLRFADGPDEVHKNAIAKPSSAGTPLAAPPEPARRARHGERGVTEEAFATGATAARRRAGVGAVHRAPLGHVSSASRVGAMLARQAPLLI
ncbi:acyl-CoA dehydrogenase family protein [Geodermatophilus sp. URMC 64]